VGVTRGGGGGGGAHAGGLGWDGPRPSRWTPCASGRGASGPSPTPCTPRTPPPDPFRVSHYRGQGLGLRVQGPGASFEGLQHTGQGSGFGVQGLGRRVQGLEVRVWDFRL